MAEVNAYEEADDDDDYRSPQRRKLRESTLIKNLTPLKVEPILDSFMSDIVKYR